MMRSLRARRVPRRDSLGMWQWSVYGCAAAAAGLAALDPSPGGAAVAAWCLLAAVAVARGARKAARAGLSRARADLLAAVREMGAPGKDVAWLNRDEHLFFDLQVTGLPGARTVVLVRVPEDDAEEFARTGRADVGCEVFMIQPVFPYVYHRLGVETVILGDDGEPAPARPRARRSPAAVLSAVWRNTRMERTGVMYASPEEVRLLAAQLAAAERMTRDSL